MTHPAEAPEPLETPVDFPPPQHVLPGPGGAVLRALPSFLIGAAGIPLLAWLTPRGGEHDWWAVGILMLALAGMYLTLLATRGPRPKQPDDVAPQRWQGALTSARRHESLPSDPKVRQMATLVAYDRVLLAVLFAGLVTGLACGITVRPDLSWTPTLGGVAVLCIMSWVRLPSAWAYLRLHAAASRA